MHAAFPLPDVDWPPTRELYAGHNWNEREQLVADSDLVEAAQRIQNLLRSEPDTTRILVHSDSSYSLLRLIYHLLPRNVAVLSLVSPEARFVPLPEGTLVIVLASPAWRYDRQRKALAGGGINLPASLLYDEDGLIIARYRRPQ